MRSPMWCHTMLCAPGYRAFCQHAADTVGCMQFLLLSFFLRFFYNRDFFPIYSLRCPEQCATP